MGELMWFDDSLAGRDVSVRTCFSVQRTTQGVFSWLIVLINCKYNSVRCQQPFVHPQIIEFKAGVGSGLDLADLCLCTHLILRSWLILCHRPRWLYLSALWELFSISAKGSTDGHQCWADLQCQVEHRASYSSAQVSQTGKVSALMFIRCMAQIPQREWKQLLFFSCSHIVSCGVS